MDTEERPLLVESHHSAEGKDGKCEERRAQGEVGRMVLGEVEKGGPKGGVRVLTDALLWNAASPDRNPFATRTSA
ncbi:unnamed protein product [Lampetra planeri]